MQTTIYFSLLFLTRILYLLLHFKFNIIYPKNYRHHHLNHHFYVFVLQTCNLFVFHSSTLELLTIIGGCYAFLLVFFFLVTLFLSISATEILSWLFICFFFFFFFLFLLLNLHSFIFDAFLLSLFIYTFILFWKIDIVLSFVVFSFVVDVSIWFLFSLYFLKVF